MALPRSSSVILSLLLATAASGVRAQSASAAPPRVGGYLQTRTTVQERSGVGFSLNRARLSADGSLPREFGYRVLIEFEASAGPRSPATVSLREAAVRWAPNGFALSAGQFKTPFSREYLLPVPVPETADFSPAVDSLAPKYDVGVMAEWSPTPWGALSLGVFNGEGQNSVANRDSVALVVARAVARPFAPVSVGASLARDSADSLRWGLEGVVEQWGGTLRGEYLLRHRRAREHERDDRGWYVFGGARLLPALQLFARRGDFQRPEIGVSRRARESTFGANWEVVPNRVRLLAAFVRRTSGARQSDARTWVTQAQVRF